MSEDRPEVQVHTVLVWYCPNQKCHHRHEIPDDEIVCEESECEQCGQEMFLVSAP